MNASVHRNASAVFAAVAMMVWPASQQDWSSWRGPHYNGAIDAKGQFDGETIGLELLWRVGVGQAYSGISIAGSTVLTMFSDGTHDVLTAFDAHTGAQQWRYRMGDMYRGHDGGHDGPLSTPVVADDRVIALGADGRLVAVDIENGSELWSTDLTRVSRARQPFWGFATTPLVVDDLVIVQAGGLSQRCLVALDIRDGSLRWSSGNGVVEYRSPVIATLNGQPTVIAPTSHAVQGVDPTSGVTRWTVSCASHISSTPVATGDGRFFVKSTSGGTMFQALDQSSQPTQLWSTDEFRGGNYAVPAPFEGCLYGFTGPHLVCVDAESGERLWRSRQPGGRGLIIVDGHLVIFGAKGDVVIARASPRGYDERARLNVSDATGYAWPSFANGVVYVRNMRHLIAVRISDTASSQQIKSPASGAFYTFIRSLEVAPDPQAACDAFMNAQDAFPIVEDNNTVHFVYRGRADDVAIRGSMLADDHEDQLYRLEGIDLFYRSYPIEPGARWEYQFVTDFDHVLADPLNPRRAPGAARMSEVTTDGWTQPAFVVKYSGRAPGRIESFRFHSAVLGDHRRVRMYLPHGYEKGARRYPTLIVTNGGEWLGPGQLPNTLHNLIDDAIEPVIVAFVDVGGGESFRELGGVRTHEYASMLARELVPQLDRRYRTRAEPSSRIVLGKRAAAVAAVYAALEHPDTFGRCIALSYGRADTIRADWIGKRMTSDMVHKPQFHISWNRYDVWRPQSFDVRQQSQALVEQLTAHGFDVTHSERTDSSGWRSWQILAGNAITSMLATPPDGAHTDQSWR